MKPPSLNYLSMADVNERPGNFLRSGLPSRCYQSDHEEDGWVFLELDSGSIRLCEAIYNSDGETIAEREVTVHHCGDKRSWRMAWSVARRVFHSRVSSPALINNEESNELDIEVQDPLATMICNNVTYLSGPISYTPKARRLRAGQTPKPMKLKAKPAPLLLMPESQIERNRLDEVQRNRGLEELRRAAALVLGLKATSTPSQPQS